MSPAELGLGLLRRAVEVLSTVRVWGLDDAELRAALVEVSRLTAGLEAVRLGLVAGLDSRPGAVAGARTGQGAAMFLVQALHVAPGRAGQDVAVARAIDPDDGELPVLGAALAAGQVSRAHLDVAVRTLARVPASLRDRVDAQGRSGAERIDAFLTEQSRSMPPSTLQHLGGHLLAALDPDGRDRFDPLAYQRRGLSCAVDATGMLVGSFQLDPAGGAVVRAALDAYGAPSPAAGARTPDGEEVLLADDRTRTQRQADALVAIARQALSRPGGGRGAATRAGSAAPSGRGGADGGGALRTQVLIVATRGDRDTGDRSAGGDRLAGTADCLQTGPVDSGTFSRLACDSVLQAVFTDRSGAALDLGRAVRTVSAAQRKALIVRDRGCAIPGCAAPVAACDAHHVTEWRHGGRTDLNNLVLLCGQHHTAVHAGIWSIRMTEDVPWVIPPPWMDPSGTPLRRPLGEAVDGACRLARQLRLPLDPQPP